jgi:hypothetical protein
MPFGVELSSLLVRPRFLALFCLVCCLSATPSWSQVLWSDDAQTQPRFVPEGVLSGREPSPLDPSVIAALHTAIRDRAALYAGRLKCAIQVLVDPGPGSTSSRPHSLPGKVRAGEIVLRARVETLVPGWDTGLGQTVTLVRLSVLENLGHTSMEPGSSVSYLQLFGEMRVDGRPVCTMPKPSDYKAVVGDELIVTAPAPDPDNDEPLAVDPGFDLYLVHDGSVTAVGLQRSPAAASISLEELRRLRSKGSRQ